MSTKKQRRFMAMMQAPLPPIEETLRELEYRAVKTYETKAQSKNAIKAAHYLLRDILTTLDAFARASTEESTLVSRSTLEKIHRDILLRFDLLKVPEVA